MNTPGKTSHWLVAPLGLLLVAVIARAIVALAVPFPASEDSAYYVMVARNLLEGRGLVSDAIWSYATPPLSLPKPAFELWMPMSTFVSAAAMAVLGHTYAAAQWGSVLFGALAAPLTWLVGRDAAAAAGLTGRRQATVALTAGALVAVFGPFLVAAAVPDSTTPFLIFGLLAALLMPRALRPGATRARLGLGLTLGLTYLSRSEAIWFGLAYLLLLVQARRVAPTASAQLSLAGNLGPVVVGGLVAVVPWLARNAATFGSPFAGQALENALITRNEQIFAFVDRPSVADFLGQGVTGIVGHQVAGLLHQLVNVLLIPAFPVGAVGIVAVLAFRRSPALRQPTALRALLLSGLLVFAATGLLFPVSTLWGTFLHASGPLLAGLCVTAALGGDALIARVRVARAWSRENAWLSAAALLALAVPLAGFESLVVSVQSARQADRIQAAADVARNLPEVQAGGPIVSDHPIWLSDALGVPVIALPDESPADVGRLIDTFHATLIVVIDDRGRYPEAFLSGTERPCTFGLAIPLGDPDHPAWFVRIQPGCQT
jgi:Dolichyl-phosphate-mannose-protein mannosyltransferase